MHINNLLFLQTRAYYALFIDANVVRSRIWPIENDSYFVAEKRDFL